MSRWSQLITYGVIAERAHAVLKSVSPAYDKFCTRTLDNAKRRLRFKQTIGDKIRGYVGLPYGSSLRFVQCADFWSLFIDRCAERFLDIVEVEDIYNFPDNLDDRYFATDRMIKSFDSTEFGDLWVIKRDLWVFEDPVYPRYIDPEMVFPGNRMRKIFNVLGKIIFGRVAGKKCVLVTSSATEKSLNVLAFAVEEDRIPIMEAFNNLKGAVESENPIANRVVWLDSDSGDNFGPQSLRFPTNWEDTKDLRFKQSKDFSLLTGELSSFVFDDVLSFIEKRKILKENDYDRRRAYLLVGPPGSGKTGIIKQIVRALPEEYATIFVGAEDISGLKLLSGIPEVSPLCIVIEDIDLLLGKSTDLQVLLNFLDGVNAPQDMITLVTTNRIDKLAPALKSRPGRIDRIFEVLPGDTAQRVAQLRELSRGIELPDTLESLAEQTEGLTFAQHRELIRRAMIYSKEPYKISEAAFFRSASECKKQFSEFVIDWKKGNF